MGAFTRDQHRFICRGICLNAPADACPAEQVPVPPNIRGYQDGTITARLGQTLLTSSALGAGAIHTIKRLNDVTPFGNAQWRVFGAGAAIFGGVSTYPQIDTGYSGNPLALAIAQPVQSPSPWIYVGDSTRQRKFDVLGHVFTMGIPQPNIEPSVVLGPLYASYLQDLSTNPLWIAAGAATPPTESSGSTRRSRASCTTVAPRGTARWSQPRSTGSIPMPSSPSTGWRRSRSSRSRLRWRIRPSRRSSTTAAPRGPARSSRQGRSARANSKRPILRPTKPERARTQFHVERSARRRSPM